MATSLPDAAGSGTLDQVKDLVEKGANVEETKYGSKPLHWALQNGNAEEKSKIIRYLVDQKADVNAKNASDMPPLHLASSAGDRASVELLLELGADRTLKVRNQTVEDLAKGAAAAFFKEEQKKKDDAGVDTVFEARAKEGKQSPEDLQRLTKSYLGGRKKKSRARKTRARKTKRRITRRR
jgi:ankyrin repeat protein